VLEPKELWQPVEGGGIGRWHLEYNTERPHRALADERRPSSPELLEIITSHGGETQLVKCLAFGDRGTHRNTYG
jgi:hypothetical protein